MSAREPHVVQLLLVEDNLGDARLAEEALRDMPGVHMTLHTVTSLAAAIARVRALPPDIVLLDLSLPDSHGIATLLRLKAEAPDVPIVILTGQDDDEVAMLAVEEGAQDYIAKSRLDGYTLVRAVRYARERHRLISELRQLAVMDELTGVQNRRGFLALAEHHIALARREGRQLALLYIDVDGMKDINDALGHPAGDEAIRGAAQLMRDTFRLSDVVGRVGGDEFCVLLTGSGWQDVDVAVARLQAGLEQLNGTGELAYHLSLSVGIARYTSTEPCSVAELMEQADATMYSHKSRRSRVTPDQPFRR